MTTRSMASRAWVRGTIGAIVLAVVATLLPVIEPTGLTPAAAAPGVAAPAANPQGTVVGEVRRGNKVDGEVIGLFYADPPGYPAGDVTVTLDFFGGGCTLGGVRMDNFGGPGRWAEPTGWSPGAAGTRKVLTGPGTVQWLIKLDNPGDPLEFLPLGAYTATFSNPTLASGPRVIISSSCGNRNGDLGVFKVAIPPTPVCTVTSQVGPGGSEIAFSGSVLNPDGNGYLQEWTFSDGTTSTASLVNKVATEPGKFTGTFRIWRTDETFDKSFACTADVAAPELAVGIGFPTRDPEAGGIPDTNFELGETVPVQLHLRATSDGVGDLSAVAFLDAPLRVNPDGAVSLVSGPTPEIPDTTTLAPGAAVVFDYEIQVDQAGPFTLLSSAQAIDAIGRTVGPVDASRQGRAGSLDVVATATPDTIDLEEEEDNSGPVPQDVAVTVEVTNPLDVAVENATLSVLEPLLEITTAADVDHTAFSYLVTPEGGGDPVEALPEEIELGTLPAATAGVAADAVMKELAGRALDSGSVDLRFIVRGTADGQPVTGTTTIRVEIRTDVDFVFDAAIDETTTRDGPGDGPWVTGGDAWEVDGSFENRTLDTTLQVVVMPLLERNAAYGIPVPLDTTPPDQDCALGTVRTLEPGESVRFSAPVRTVVDGTTRSGVRYQPQVYELGPDGTRTPVDPERVLVTPGSGEHTVSVDTRPRQPDYDAGAGEIVWAYGKGTIDGIGETFYGLGAMGYAVLDLGLQPWEWPAAYDAAGAKVAEYTRTIYANLSPVDRTAWNESWISAVALGAGMTLDDARTLVDRMALESFTELDTAWQTGDYTSVAGWWGKQTGANIDSVLGGLTKAVGVCKLISAKTPWAKAALLAKERQVASEVAALGSAATAKTIPTGAALNRNLRRSIWGVDDVMYQRVQDFVDDFGILIGVRRRGPGSIAKIEAGTHYPKGYHNKAKNIAAGPDTGFLGFLDDIDTAAIKEPPLLQDLETEFLAKGTPADVQAKVRARHKTRMKEWYGPGVDVNTGLGGNFTKSERYKWATYANDGFPVPKEGSPVDYSQNVRAGRSTPPDSEITVRVPARIKTVVGTDGRPQMILEIDKGQGFKPSTGDMDPLFVAKADFSLLPEAKRIEFYERANELGFEHAESASWDNPGRNEYIDEFSDRNPDGEAMFTWVPNSVPRATRFDPQMSWNRVDPNAFAAGTIYIKGSNVVLNSPDPALGGPIPEPDDSHPFISPKTFFLIDSRCGGGPDAQQSTSSAATPAAVAGTCSIVFDRGPNAVILRQAVTSELERWTAAEGWQPFVISAAGAIPILPQTVSTGEAAAGTSRIEIASAADLDLVPGLDQWFAVGDMVVIDPGGPNEEYAEIGGFGSLIFTEPLQFEHPAGTVISVVEPLGDPTNPADPNGPIDPVDPVDPSTPVDPTAPAVPTPSQGPAVWGGTSNAGSQPGELHRADAVAATGGQLPYTGGDGHARSLALLALSLLGAGLLLTIATRRRRPSVR